MTHQSLGQRLSSLKIGQKIGVGYILALGIAVSGSIAGFGVGHHYQERASDQEDHARNEVEFLHRLQSGVLQARTHQQQLIPLILHPEKFQEEYSHLLHHQTEIRRLWAELKQMMVSDAALHGQEHQEAVPEFIKTYDAIPQQYSQAVEQRVAQIRQMNLNVPAEAERAKQLLLEFTNSDLALQFDGISDDLTDLIEHAYEELEQAESLQQQAVTIANLIMIGSIGLSVAIAIVLALWTSRAIARPIQSLTQVAQKVTDESNFELQATVYHDDEIGKLAQAFNQLIQAVQDLVRQQQIDNERLETYNQTLESKVEARTEELNSKNQQLQQLLEELKHTQVQMVQSEKMSALGQMVAGVAHEINNPVNFIHGNLSYVQEYAQGLLEIINLYQEHYPVPVPAIEAEADAIDLEFIQADLPKMLDSMKVGTERIRRIVLSLRNFSRMDEAACKTVDLHEGLDSTLLILQHRLKEKPERPAIQVVCEYGELPLVECYPGPINQAFMNILANAIDALEEANSQHTYADLQQHPNQITIRTSLVDSQWVKIVIADNGIGMPESVQKRIFDPFFTTKAVGQGTGMGMPITYQIVTEKHQGQLQCSSQPGQGTAFTIVIPTQQAGQESGYGTPAQPACPLLTDLHDDAA